MRTALAFWRRSQVSASTSTHVFHRPDEINWLHVAIKMGLSLILAGNLLAPFAARAQNLGTAPAVRPGRARSAGDHGRRHRPQHRELGLQCHCAGHRSRVPRHRGMAFQIRTRLHGLGRHRRRPHGDLRSRTHGGGVHHSSARHSVVKAESDADATVPPRPPPVAARSRGAGGVLHAGCRGSEPTT